MAGVTNTGPAQFRFLGNSQISGNEFNGPSPDTKWADEGAGLGRRLFNSLFDGPHQSWAGIETILFVQDSVNTTEQSVRRLVGSGPVCLGPDRFLS